MLGNKTQFKLLYQHVADYSYLKTFGCLAFVSTLSTHRHKFAPRARMCVFIGYPNGVKGYKLYDLQTKQIFISRDVIFHQHVLPFHSITSIDSIIDPFLDLVLPSLLFDISLDPIPPLSSSPTFPPILAKADPPIIPPLQSTLSTP